MPINYVTYDAAGNLTGVFQQDLQPEHEGCYIIVGDDVRAAWVNYRANDTRDDVTPIPVPVPAPQPTLGEAKTHRTVACDLLAKAKRDQVVADISPAEMASWPIKLAEAQAFTASGDSADAPKLALEADVRGIALADLVAKVIAKGAALSQLEAVIAGTNGRHNDAIKALADVSAVLAYDITQGWPV